MALPGFTAAQSLGPTVQTYRMASYYGLAAAGYLVPQQYVGDVDIEDLELAEEEMEADVADIEEETTEEPMIGEEM